MVFLIFVLSLLSLLSGCGKKSASGSKVIRSAPVDLGISASDQLLVVNGCEVRDVKGGLVKLFPGSRCAFLQGGDLVSIQSKEMFRISSHNRIVWRIPVEGHHELDVMENGNILMLSQEARIYHNWPARFDLFDQISPKGKLLVRWRAFDHMAELRKLHRPHPILDLHPRRGHEEPPYIPIPSSLFHSPGYAPALGTPLADRFAEIPPLVADDRFSKPPSPSRDHGPGPSAQGSSAGMNPRDSPPKGKGPPPGMLEYYHINSVYSLVSNSVEAKIPAFKAGNFLLSFCNFSFLAIINGVSGEVLWSYKTPGFYPGQHDAKLIPNGHILMFVNNNVCGDGYCSSVMEVDPVTRKVVWEYRAAQPKSFHATFMGSVQRLPNGNTLICSTPEGRPGEVFEVTPDKRVVWRWKIPVGDHYRPMHVRRRPAGPLLRMLQPF